MAIKIGFQRREQLDYRESGCVKTALNCAVSSHYRVRVSTVCSTWSGMGRVGRFTSIDDKSAEIQQAGTIGSGRLGKEAGPEKRARFDFLRRVFGSGEAGKLQPALRKSCCRRQL